MRSWVALGLVVMSLSALAAQGRQAIASDPLLTTPERTGYEQTSRYDETVAFLRAIDRASPLVHLTTYGYTHEGRPLPLVVAGRVRDASPDAVRTSGLTRVYLQGNIHAGEVEGKEVLQMLVRDLVRGRHAHWLKAMVLLIAPLHNADGNERVALDQRPLQHGPLGGVGQRPNAQGLDLNRDHTKLEAPETRSFVRLLRDFDPHLVVDLHTTNGTHHAYRLTYAPPLHPGTPPEIVSWLRTDWLPSITRAIKADDGWDLYHYGNIPDNPAIERGWYTFDHRPRFGTNYVGLRNRFAILSEAYAYLSFRERIEVTRRFVKEILDVASRNAARMREMAAAADRASVVGRPLPLTARLARSATPVEILLGGVERARHPLTGAVTLRRTDERRPELMPEFGTFSAATEDVVPRAYFVPASLDRVIELLQAHGIRTFAVTRDATLDVETFKVESTQLAERAAHGHHERTVTGQYVRQRQTIPAGTVVISMEQPLARLAFILLEPRSDDGIVTWNMTDAVWTSAAKAGPFADYPIRRTSDAVDGLQE